MIKYNNSNINKWNYGSDNIVKVYRNNAVCYYKISGGGDTPTAQTPCYAVVDDISQYSDTEFVDVFNKADSKWYKLNNLNQYEEYGIYGSGRTITTYDGKLTIDDGYEYMYSGSSWVNVGEVSGSSRVPIGYTEVEYIENTTTGTNYYIDTQFKPNQDTRVIVEAQPSVLTNNPRMFGSGPWNGLAFVGNIENLSPQKFYFKYGQTSSWYTTNVQADTNKHTFDLNKNSYYIDGVLANTASTATFQLTTNLGIFNAPATSLFNNDETFIGKVFSCKVYDNGTLIKDYVPCKRDSDSKSGLYDVVNDVFYTAVNTSYNFTLGAETGTTEYPIYYDSKSNPPDNLSFSSMTEAEAYECPWVGMNATIDGDKYIFSGDSISGYEWVYSPIDYSTHYLTMVAETNNVSFAYSTASSNNKLNYSLDGGSTWSELGNNQSTTSINSGDKIMFRASSLTVDTERGIGKITPSASATVEGNIMSLEYGDNFIGQTVVQNNYQFRKLFSGVTTITSAENMILPATTVKQQCYSQMFQGCTNLVKTPKTIGSSAMTWSGSYCMSNMFSDCTSLVNVSSTLLPALNLGTQCYWYMFENSTSLIESPLLLATTLEGQSYQGMFNGCSSLNTITCLATNQSNSTNDWTTGVAATGTFYKHPSASWSSGNNGIPSTWTVVDYTS